MNRFNNLSFDRKYGNLASFRQDLNKLSSLKPRKSHTKENRIIALNIAPELYNDLPGMYFDEFVNFSFSKARMSGSEYDSKNLFLHDYDYDVWYEKLDDKTLKKLDDKTLKKLVDTTPKKIEFTGSEHMPLLECNEKKQQKEKD